MTTYYQILQISPGAMIAEIEAAYEARYNHWRRLVTHHDPDMVNKANQALQALEQIRVILTDSKRRAAYDASLQVTSGGPSDLRALLRTHKTPPASLLRGERPHAAQKVVSLIESGASERVDAWICPQCQMAHPLQSMFCKKCGHTIGLSCPDCGTVVEAAAEFCAACGTNLPKSVRRREVRAQLTAREQELAQVEVIDPRQDKTVRRLKKATVAAGAWMGASAACLASLVLGWSYTVPLTPDLYTWGLGGLLVQPVFTLVLMLARRTFSFSAFLATIGGLTILTIPYFFYFTDPYTYWGPRGIVFIIAVCYCVVDILATLSALGLGATLGRHGGWIWFLILLVVSLAMCAPLPQIIVLFPDVYYYYGEFLGDYTDLVDMAVIGCYILLAVSFGFLGLRGWWTTHRIEHQVAVALNNKHRRAKHLRYEIDQLSRELNVLQK